MKLINNNFQKPNLTKFTQLTLTLQNPIQSQPLNDAFKKQLEKLDVIVNEILKIQEFMNVSHFNNRSNT